MPFIPAFTIAHQEPFAMTDSQDRMAQLRDSLSQVNREILRLAEKRVALVEEMRAFKAANGLPMYDPVRESRMFQALLAESGGVLSESEVRAIFRPIFQVSLARMEGRSGREMRIARRQDDGDRVVRIGGKGACIGGQGQVAMIAGPCAVESEEQMEEVASTLEKLGVPFLRGGAFKPRTSPDAFQGLGAEGLRILRGAADRHGLAVVTEVTDTSNLDQVAAFADVIQIGARNMMNYALLQAVGRSGRPVILKRGFAATLDEFLNAAEYLAKEGACDIVLCERGIRTFQRDTRFTLDVAAIPILRQKTALPVIADVSHAAGRRDLVTPLARAALAAGASGLMVEVHPCPEAALSDADQQLSLPEFQKLLLSVMNRP